MHAPTVALDDRPQQSADLLDPITSRDPALANPLLSAPHLLVVHWNGFTVATTLLAPTNVVKIQVLETPQQACSPSLAAATVRQAMRSASTLGMPFYTGLLVPPPAGCSGSGKVA